jgi:hypothetical protein
MELAPVVPAWLTWIVAGGVGVLAVAIVIRMLEAAIDLDHHG